MVCVCVGGGGVPSLQSCFALYAYFLHFEKYGVKAASCVFDLFKIVTHHKFHSCWGFFLDPNCLQASDIVILKRKESNFPE